MEKPSYRKEYCPKCNYSPHWKDRTYMEYRPGPLTIREPGRKNRGRTKPTAIRLINGYFLCHKCGSMYYTVTLKRFHTHDIVVEDKHRWEAINTTGEELGKSSVSVGVK
jgi:hypothetical protein